MANELPPAADCEGTDTTDCTDPTEKCYTAKEALPACSDLSPASSIQSSDCTRLDKTFDIVSQGSVVPAVGNTIDLYVCNAALYNAGSWIEIVSGSAKGSVFQIISINTVDDYIKVQNACIDGETAIESNASPGATIDKDSAFIVVGAPSCKTTEEKATEFQALFPEFEDVCWDNVPDRPGTETAEMLGVVSESECDESGSSPQPCMRKLQTKELADGTLKLGNVDETPETEDKTIVPLFADVKNRVVTGAVTKEVYEWIKQTEEEIETWNAGNIPNTSEFDETYIITGDIPEDANYAIVRMIGGVDDPGGNIAVKFGNLVGIVLEVASDYSNNADALAKIADGKINYKVFAYNGGFMAWSGNTHLKMSIVGFKRVTEIQ